MDLQSVEGLQRLQKDRLPFMLARRSFDDAREVVGTQQDLGRLEQMLRQRLHIQSVKSFPLFGAQTVI
jgi:hypothetical protein